MVRVAAGGQMATIPGVYEARRPLGRMTVPPPWYDAWPRLTYSASNHCTLPLARPLTPATIRSFFCLTCSRITSLLSANRFA